MVIRSQALYESTLKVQRLYARILKSTLVDHEYEIVQASKKLEGTCNEKVPGSNPGRGAMHHSLSKAGE
jgi:hypothetical protein